MTVTLRPITQENWVECVELNPNEAQVKAQFVAPNTLSLAQAAYETWWQPLGIYADEVMVGFILAGTWPASGLPSYFAAMPTGEDYILRFMIDERYQGKGYGRAALTQLIKKMRGRGDATAVSLSYEPENEAAAALYASLGFRLTGHEDDGEVEARLEF